jgi:hypothetical protein
MAVREERDRLAGWRLEWADGASRLSDILRDKLTKGAIAAAAGERNLPTRRSRHAATYQVSVAEQPGRPRLETFVKVYDSPHGFGALKRRLRGSSAAHATAISRALAAQGFGVAAVILCGEEHRHGRAMLVTERAAGVSLAAFLGAPHPAQLKRRILCALGAEVARLHRAGYVHGDLTPHNIFVANYETAGLIFIDHDRTRQAFVIGRRRRQLRNLVQLLRFDLPRLTRTDRMRIFRAWAAALELQRSNRLMHRVFNMLKLRLAKDRGKARAEQSMDGGPGPGVPLARNSSSTRPQTGRAG